MTQKYKEHLALIINTAIAAFRAADEISKAFGGEGLQPHVKQTYRLYLKVLLELEKPDADPEKILALFSKMQAIAEHNRVPDEFPPGGIVYLDTPQKE